MTCSLAAALADLPRTHLLTGPTPLEHWPRLSEAMGVRLFVKRDDLTGIGMGGNKLRKLEYIMGAALADGCTVALTTGGPQSNHARLTAAVAAKLGMRCILLLRGSSVEHRGNLLLDALFGADVRFLGNVDYSAIYEIMDQESERLRTRGERPIAIPLGGANALGTAGYAAAYIELEEQMARLGLHVDIVALAAGTASTYAGLAIGAAQATAPARLLGISVSWTRERLESEVARLTSEAAMLMRLGASRVPSWFDDRFIGPGYAVPSDQGVMAVLAAARLEGVVLDTTYTGKALGGLVGLIQEGAIAPGSTVAFIHTGGAPELFTRDTSLFADSSATAETLD